MSGVTYNLMAIWPDKTVYQVYAILCAIWKHKSTPPFWKWRWLVPIPKKPDNHTLSNLRPISLIEASRKLWINFFINKIKRFWCSSGLLCPSQHAFLSSKSTEGALLQFRNVLEEVEETRSNLFLSSWDIKRAFDRVPKPILVLSWVRLGVPQEIATYLVGLDRGGTTVIRTPYTEKRFRKRGYAQSIPAFQAEVGTGQGDVGSPLNWIAFFDILLCALSSLNGERPMIRLSQQLLSTIETGYADDLVSGEATLQSLQRKADIVSAFAIVFGLDIAVTKLRACLIQWGQECPTPGEEDATLLVRTFGWSTPSSIAIVKLSSPHDPPLGDDPPDLALKYLGVLFDYSNSDRTSYQTCVSLLKKKLDTLYTKFGDKELKIEAIIYCLYPRLRYPAKLASWPLSTFHSLDRLFSVAFRRILQLPRTFPHGLL
jgi:hypothetical protein